MTPPLPPADLLPLLDRIDRWQAEVRELFPGVVPCRAGCAACCRGPFDISVADALLVSEAVAALPAALRREVETRASAQLERMAGTEPRFRAPWDLQPIDEPSVDAMIEAEAEVPCPALGDGGECLIYAARPATCRFMGLGLRTAGGEVMENGCPIQEEFPAYRALAPQPFDLDGWHQLEEVDRRRAAMAHFGSPLASDFETTVAGAVMFRAGVTEE